MKRTVHLRSSTILAATLCALAVPSLKADTFTWAQTAGGTTYDWTNPANWAAVAFPNSPLDIANLNIDILGNQSVRLQQNITIGTLNWGDANGSNTMVISTGTGTNTLTFEGATAGSPAFFNVLGTTTVTNTISAPIALGGTSPLIWTAGPQIVTQTGTFTTNGNNVTLAGGANQVASWNVNGDLIGGGTITYNGLGGISVNGTVKSFTGSFVLNRGVSGVSNAGSLSVTTGSIANAAEVTINGFLSAGIVQNGGSLHSGNNSAAPNNPGQRLTQNTFRLNGGSLTAGGQTATVGVANDWQMGLELVVDSVNLLDFNSGYSLLGIGASATTAGTRLNIATMERSPGASAFARGSVLGTTGRILITNIGTFLRGAGGAEGTMTMSIVPWMGVNDTNAGTSLPVGFGTYGANGVRALTNAEYASSITAGSTFNVTTGNLALTGPTTVNALRLSSFATPANIGAGQELTVSSGGVFFQNNGSTLGAPGNVAAGTLAFGSAEGVVWSNSSNINTIGSVLSGTGGLSKAGTGTLILAGANTYSGLTYIGSGVLQVGDGVNPSNLGLFGDVTVASGATLSLFNGLAIADSATLTLEQFGLFNGKVSLSPGVNETIGALFFNNGFAAAGTYGSTTSSATFQNDTYFSGTGLLTVIPEPGSIASVLGGVGLLLGLQRRRR